MATVIKPIALDESLNTTELSSRNVADVLAQELSAVATAISGISAPSAEDVSYDNSVSGLSATDVQNALDEIVSDIPTVNNGTLTIQQNGTSIGSFSANTASNVTANIKTPTADKKTATDQFTTADGGLLEECNIELEPVQNLHGYPNPWVGGAGKNKLTLTISNLKSNNTSGTWSGNSYTHNGITYAVQTDNDNNVIGIKVTDTASGDSTLFFTKSANYTQYPDSMKINGCPSGGSTSTYFMRVQMYSPPYTRIGDDTGSGSTFSIPDNSQNYQIIIRIKSGYACPSGGLLFYPMLRLATESDSTFAPYTNICPISGHTEVDLDVKDGDNVTQHTYQVQIGSTVYGGYVDLVSGVMRVDRVTVTYNGTESWIDSSSLPDYYQFQRSASDSVNLIGAICDKFKSIGLSDRGTQNGLVTYTDKGVRFALLPSFGITTAEQWKTWLSNNPTTICYKLATPIAIQLTPQQIETLAGENNLSTPLDGQSIETNGVEYKELFTFADVKEYVDKKIPDAPTTDGTYTLQAVVSGGVPTYSWV